jgi:hypothetical protein
VLPEGATTRGLRTFGILILLVMLTRLIGPFREYLRNLRAQRRSKGGEGS